MLDFFGHSVNCTKGIDASPHTNYLQIFKKRPGPLGLGWCALLRVVICLFAGSRYRLPSEGGRIIAMSFNPSTFTFLLPCCLFRVATQAARGAQYSPDSRVVNALSYFFSEGLSWGRFGTASRQRQQARTLGPRLRPRISPRLSRQRRAACGASGLWLELDPGKAVRAHLENVVRAGVKGETTV